LDEARAKAEAVEQKARSLQELIAEAERELQEAVPEAAKAICAALAVNRGMGPSGSTVGLKAAELLLTHFPVKPGKAARILEPPAKPEQRGSSAPQVIIGLKIDQLGPRTEPVMQARQTVLSALPAAETE
jgi:hypothetical protein